jgi:hypothetical protein
MEFAAAHQPAGKLPFGLKLREITGMHETQGWCAHGPYFSSKTPNGASGSEVPHDGTNRQSRGVRADPTACRI